MLQYIQMSERAAVRGHMLLHIHVSTQPTLLVFSFFIVSRGASYNTSIADCTGQPISSTQT